MFDNDVVSVHSAKLNVTRFMSLALFPRFFRVTEFFRYFVLAV